MINRRQLIFLIVLLVVTAGAIAFMVVSDRRARGDRVPKGTAEQPEPAVPDDEEFAPDETVPDEADQFDLYLVLDDAGQAIDEIKRLKGFSGPYTLAVLPDLPHSLEVTKRAIAEGHEVILHQPMEALNGEDPGPGAIFADQSEEEIRAVLRENMQRYPGFVGMNNHMGSRITSDPRVVEIILDVIAETGLFFLDSRTTASSVVPTVASGRGMTVLVRQVFLDHYREADTIREQLDLALEIARATGSVIMIGHVTVPETLQLLIEREDELVAEGFRFRPLSHAYQEAIGADAGY